MPICKRCWRCCWQFPCKVFFGNALQQFFLAIIFSVNSLAPLWLMVCSGNKSMGQFGEVLRKCLAGKVLWGNAARMPHVACFQHESWLPVQVGSWGGFRVGMRGLRGLPRLWCRSTSSQHASYANLRSWDDVGLWVAMGRHAAFCLRLLVQRVFRELKPLLRED